MTWRAVCVWEGGIYAHDYQSRPSSSSRATYTPARTIQISATPLTLAPPFFTTPAILAQLLTPVRRCRRRAHCALLEWLGAASLGSVPEEQRQHDVEVLCQLTPSTGRKSIQSSAVVGKQSHAPRTHKVVRPHFFESLGCVLYL